MAWFRNYYRCAECLKEWEDEWSCMCDDDCPHCGARHMSPYDRDDLTEIIEEREDEYVVYRSPSTAEHYPNYERIAIFPTLEQAEIYLKLRSTERNPNHD